MANMVCCARPIRTLPGSSPDYNDFLELFGGLRGNRFGRRGVAAVQMYGEIAEVRGYIRRIHYLGFAVARFAWLRRSSGGDSGYSGFGCKNCHA